MVLETVSLLGVPLLLQLLLVPAAAAAAAAQSAAISIGNSTQLFVDDFLIQSKVNLTRSMHSPDLSRVAITADAPWERNYTVGMIGTSVILDDGKIRLWYSLRNNTLGCRPANVPRHQSDQPPCDAHVPPQPNYVTAAGNIYIGYAESSARMRSTRPRVSYIKNKSFI